MKIVLKNDDGLMIANIDRVNAKIEFTTNPTEAITYNQGDWFATTELEYLKFHMGKDYKELNTMQPSLVDG